MEWTPVDVKYLKRYGEWADVPLIMASVQSTGLTLLSAGVSKDRYRESARALYAIGKHRLSDLFRITPSVLLSYIIVEAADSNFRRLSNESIGRLLANGNDGVRKAAALKAVKAMTRVRVESLLSVYLENAQRYYNVVHWLDLGKSAPKHRAKAAARKAIEEGWGD
jgi:hypothetical protein